MLPPGTAADATHALALVVVDELARCGVTEAVLAPGSRSTPFVLALAAEPRIRLHVEIDERSAGFLAVGIARASGRPAVVLTTSGTATANLLPAVVEADTGRVPLLVLTADRPPELRHTGANQAIDQRGLYGRAVRHDVELGAPADVPGAVHSWRSTIARCVAAALGAGGPAGPVHLNAAVREPLVPGDEPGFSQPLDGRPSQAPWTAVTAVATPPDVGLVAELAARVVGTERGVIVVGDCPGLDPLSVGALSGATGWPVLSEPHGNARTGEHALASGPALLRLQRVRRSMAPDMVLRLGRIGLSRDVLGWLRPGTHQLLVDPDAAWLDPNRAVSHLLACDPTRFCDELTTALALDADSSWRNEWQELDRTARAAMDDVLDDEDGTTEPRVARDLAACLPNGSLLVAAASMPIRDLDLAMRPRAGLRVVSNRGASGIDGFVSTTLGAALVHDGPVVALTGDLSLLHDANGFLLRPDAEGVDAVFVVVDNDGGGIFHFLPQHDHPDVGPPAGPFERVLGTPHGRDLARLAALHEITHTPIASADDLAPAVDAAIAAGGIHLLHVRTDRDANLALHRRIDAAVDAAIA